jgi:hypothetical protein
VPRLCGFYPGICLTQLPLFFWNCMFFLKQRWIEVTYILFTIIACALCIKELCSRCVSSVDQRSGSLLVHGYVPFPHCTYYHHDHQRIYWSLKWAIWQALSLQIRENWSQHSSLHIHSFGKASLSSFLESNSLIVVSVKIMPTAALPEILHSCWPSDLLTNHCCEVYHL